VGLEQWPTWGTRPWIDPNKGLNLDLIRKKGLDLEGTWTLNRLEGLDLESGAGTDGDLSGCGAKQKDKGTRQQQQKKSTRVCSGRWLLSFRVRNCCRVWIVTSSRMAGDLLEVRPDCRECRKSWSTARRGKEDENCKVEKARLLTRQWLTEGGESTSKPQFL
jgi:hypothetical protein